MVDIASPESKTRGLFHAWVNYNYFTSLAVGIRRLCDPDSRTRSLVRLLTEIEEHVAELTGDWRVGRRSRAGGEPSERYLKEFDELSSEGEHVDPALVRKDLEELHKALEAVKPYVNKYVAHLDADRKSFGSVKLGELHAAVDRVYQVFHCWYQLVSNVILTAPLVEPWEHGFTVAWITEDQAFRATRSKGS